MPIVSVSCLYHFAAAVYKRIRNDKLQLNAAPQTINFQVNDICNSKCQMCSIWKRKRDRELSPEEFGTVLQDPLFSKVRHIGVTGGEPTLRKDLAKFFDVAFQTLPKLKGMSSITNAIQAKHVIERISQTAEVCHKHEKTFTLMVSLDGIGEVHNTIRGRKGNFETALKVIRHFQLDKNVDLLTGTTITKDNVWYVDEVLDFLQNEGVYGRFRMGEFINRLYNSDSTKIRNFTEDEIYHLVCFFEKLQTTYEKNPVYQQTYQNIQKMLLGQERSMACPFQSKAVSLDCRSDLYYCAPKSQKLGNILAEGGGIYNQNIAERKRIIQEDCAQCIHDYHSPLELDFYIQKIKITALRIAIKRNWWLTLKLAHQFFKKEIRNKKIGYHVFITGWYGTETVGDKAILASIIEYYRNRHPPIELAVSSLHPFVTERTLRELGYSSQIKVISVYSLSFLHYCRNSDEVVMGGGPLMGIDALGIPLLAFQYAKSARAKRVIFGCGIGPLRQKKHINYVKRILLLSSEVSLRDSASQKWVQKNISKPLPVKVVDDPSIAYIKKYKDIHVKANQKIIACFLREWTQEYSDNHKKDTFLKTKTIFESKIAVAIQELAEQRNAMPYFYSMHNFVIGNDDRDFYRKFTKNYFKKGSYYLENRLSTVQSICQAMQEAHICICMRFHSVIFAHTLGRFFAAIDYTNGGKISYFLNQMGLEKQFITLKQVVQSSHFSLKEYLPQ